MAQTHATISIYSLPPPEPLGLEEAPHALAAAFGAKFGGVALGAKEAGSHCFLEGHGAATGTTGGFLRLRSFQELLGGWRHPGGEVVESLEDVLDWNLA